MDLIGAIVNHYVNGDESQAVALRAALGTGKLIAGLGRQNRARPYATVDEVDYDKIYECFGMSQRVESILVEFHIYSDTKASLITLLDSFEDCYLNKNLSADNMTILGQPTIEERMSYPEEDHWRGTIQFQYNVQRALS